MKTSLLPTAVIAVALAVFYALVQQAPNLIVESTDVLFILVSGGVSFYGFLVIVEMRREKPEFPHLEEKLRHAYYGIFLAIFLWFLGETIWGIYEVILRVPIPYPSIADIFYLAGYLPALTSTTTFAWIFRPMVTARRKIAASLVGLTIMGVVSVFLLRPLMMSSSDIVTKTFDLAYPLLDAVLVVLGMMILVGFWGLTLARPWRWVLVGILLTSLADIMFSWGTLTGWYYSGHPIELLWLYSYLAFAIAFKEQKTDLHHADQAPTQH